MLQKYDAKISTVLLALAAAGGVTFAAPAHADWACSAEDGYGLDLVDYVQEAKTCLAAATGQRGDLAEALLTRINEKRDAAGARPLTANE
ncbi:MAG: hypothetical protein AAGF20_04420, partial [Pseudomonadota bacterium]